MAQQPNLERLRLTSLDLRSSGRRNSARRPTRAHGLFLKGPISLPWLSAAARLPGRSLHVAVGIRLLVGMKKTNRIALSVSWLAELGLSRHAAYRGLKALEGRGCRFAQVLFTQRAGREFDLSLLSDLPPAVDPCGERGEFHSLVYAGPMFDHNITVELGEIVDRDGFVFADVQPTGTQ